MDMVEASILNHSEYDLIFMDVQASRTTPTFYFPPNRCLDAQHGRP
jgi:hypothetical protein